MFGRKRNDEKTGSQQEGKPRAGLGAVLALGAGLVTVAAIAAPTAAVSVDQLRNEINLLEKDLLQTSESQSTAASQLKKVRKLLSLQQKEIALSKQRLAQLNNSMAELSGQKQLLLAQIETQKAELRRKLIELNRLTEGEALDASWLANLDAQNQKSYFLSKMLRKDLKSVERYRADVTEAMALELRILEEKNKIDYYVQELHGQMAQLTANERLQTEILKSNRASRLEALARVRVLKESERELERMISNFRGASVARSAPGVQAAVKSAEPETSVDLTLAAMKGRLPFPVSGPIVSGFGKSYNSKTSLLTFQKGITLGTAPAIEVRAVSSGKVVFAGPLNNYGQILILEHPGQYFTLYGQLGSIAVENGAVVPQGTVVGKTSQEPFYFEIRNRNIAINPLQWLNNNSITLSKH